MVFLRNLLQNKTIRSAVFTSPLAIIRLGTGFVRSKYAALALGAAGVGLLSQANLFFTLLASVGSLGLVNGLMQRMSYYKEQGNVAELLKVKGTTLIAQLLTLAILIVPLLFFIGPLNRYLFNTADTAFYADMFFLLLGIPVSVITSNYIEGFFTAYSRFDLYVKGSSFATILSLLLFFPFVYFWGIHGAIIHIWVNVFILFLLFLYYVKKLVDYKDVFVFRFDRTIFNGIFKEGIINLACAALTSLVALLIRNKIVHQQGETENGIYQIVISITAYYTPFITNPLWANYFPVLSAKGVTKETEHVIHSTLKYAIIASSAVCMIILTIPELLIRVVASPQFLKAIDYFPLQLLGDAWYFIFFIFGIYLLSQRRVRQYLFIWTVFLVIQYIVAALLIGRLGVKGAAIAYSSACLIIGLYALYEFGKLISRKEFVRVLELLGISFLFLAGLAVCCLYGGMLVLKVTGLILWGLSLLIFFNYINIKKFKGKTDG